MNPRFYKLISNSRSLAELSEWVCKNLMGKEINIENHADIQIISPEGTKGYLIEQLAPVLKSLSMRPIELEKQLIIFDSPELLSEKIQNKLLKTLEEPNHADIIFYTSEGTSFLPTVESRAIDIKIGRRSFHQADDMSKLADSLAQIDLPSAKLLGQVISKQKSQSSICDYLKKHRDEERKLVVTLFELLGSIELDYSARERLIDAMKEYQDGLTFNSPLAARVSILLTALSQ